MSINSLNRVDDVIAQVDMFLNQDIDPYPSNEDTVISKNFTTKQNSPVDRAKQDINDLLMRAHISPPPDPNIRPHIKLSTETYNNFDPLNQNFETMVNRPGSIYIQKRFTGDTDTTNYDPNPLNAYEVGSSPPKPISTPKYDYHLKTDPDPLVSTMPTHNHDLSGSNPNLQFTHSTNYLGSSKSESFSKIQSAADIEADMLRQENDKLRVKLMEGKSKYQRLRETNNELLTKLERQQAEIRHLKNRK